MAKELEGTYILIHACTQYNPKLAIVSSSYFHSLYYREYGDFNLDELCEGDRIGMVRKGETGSLHFYINGLDQGVAATRVPSQMWGVVDLYGMTVKVRLYSCMQIICRENGLRNH